MSDDEDTHDQSYTEDIDFLPVNILDDGEYICADAQPTGPSSPYFSNDTFSSPTGKPQSAAGEREGGSCVRLPSCHVPAPCYAGWKDLAVLRVDSCCFGTCHCVISFPPQIARSSLGGTFDKQWSQSGTCIYIYIYISPPCTCLHCYVFSPLFQGTRSIGSARYVIDQVQRLS